MTSAEPSDVEQEVLAYIAEQVDDGTHYIKSSHITQALDLSVKRVGAAMAKLEKTSTPFEMTRWGGDSDGITWYITRRDD
jgi:hypothetical protein